jgi:2-polyprenyl-6-hydroxyphenyl methylase/3-demethylubiquinone-9 3-methyltransferase
MEPPLARTDYPWRRFRRVCREGLGAVRPFSNRSFPDPYGWNFGPARPPSYWAYGRMRALLAEADAVACQPRRVLEVAAGDGALCAVLAARGCQVTANDLRTETLAENLVRFSNADQIRLLGGNLFELDPEQTGRFDLVIACEVLEHVAHSVDFLRQLRRFLEPGGRALVTTPNGDFFRNRLPTWSQVTDFQALESQQFKPDADGHLFLITPDEMAHLAAESGFSVERLSVWGSPFISGNAKFSILARPGLDRLACSGEAAVQFLPAIIRRQLCTALVAVLRA